MKRQLFTSGLVFNVYNFHKSNWSEIRYLFLLHFFYAACVIAIPTAIKIGEPIGVFAAIACTYSMFSVVINIKLTTVYGKALRAIACTLGGYLSWYSIINYTAYIALWNLFN